MTDTSRKENSLLPPPAIGEGTPRPQEPEDVSRNRAGEAALGGEQHAETSTSDVPTSGLESAYAVLGADFAELHRTDFSAERPPVADWREFIRAVFLEGWAAFESDDFQSPEEALTESHANLEIALIDARDDKSEDERKIASRELHISQLIEEKSELAAEIRRLQQATARPTVADCAVVPADGTQQSPSTREGESSSVPPLAASPAAPSSKMENYMPIDADLLPCPFCGEKAVLTNVRMSDHTFHVGCVNESCFRPRADGYNSKADVTALWNRRAASPAAEAPPQDEEPLHTGDDPRIDCISSIRAAVESAKDGEDEGHNCTEVDEALSSILGECDVLDLLLIETIKRESQPGALPAASGEWKPPTWQPTKELFIDRLNAFASHNGCSGHYQDDATCVEADPNDVYAWCAWCLMQELAKRLPSSPASDTGHPQEKQAQEEVRHEVLAQEAAGSNAIPSPLLAAAPELLNALKMAAQLMEDADFDNQDEPEAQVLSIARAAIAKAEGGR